MDVKFLKGVGEKRAAALCKLGIRTVYDLLCHFPVRYVDYSATKSVKDCEIGEIAALQLTILKKHPPRRIAGGRMLFKVLADDGYENITITYFNNPYVADALDVGGEYIFYGRIGGGYGTKELLSPTHISADAAVKQTAVYPLTSGITSKYLSGIIAQALRGHGKQLITEILPADMLARYNLIDRFTAISEIHFPQSLQGAAKARYRLVFEELLCFQLGMHKLKNIADTAKRQPMQAVDMEPFYKKLPFSPTGAQLKAIDDIGRSFLQSSAQNRLVQGDVGSGKTLVATAAAYMAAKNGLKTIIMAPTEILCSQHTATVEALLSGAGIDVIKLSGTIKGAARKVILQRLVDEKPCVLVATSAVLTDTVNVSNVGLCVVDEQHRFGVKQRTKLFDKANNPHLLVMSATPIPRTLALLMYSDLDVSIINELPKGRKPIKTRLVTTKQRAGMYGFLDDEIEKGNRVYVVCPAIEEGESGLLDVQSYYSEVATALLPHRRIGLLHGRMNSKDKASVMQSFKDGELDMLCSTTVIEVGVDVPQASVIVIESAQQFGLATLHQLRGRVGRGAAESWCFLVSDSKNEQTLERLHRLVETSNGFEIAQYDLKTRGPGNFFGSEQHGLPPLSVAKLAQDAQVLEVAAEASEFIMEEDAQLVSPKHVNLAREVCRLLDGVGASV